ncbi:MAG: hypothetical protein ACK5R4_00980 [Alphaproteobacteria bacterium]
MKISAAILLFALLGVATAASAQQATPQPRPSPEQRAAVKEKWQNATPEERAAWKANHPEAVKRFGERKEARQQRRPGAAAQ